MHLLYRSNYTPRLGDVNAQAFQNDTLPIFLLRVQRLYRLTPRLKAGINSSIWRYSAGSYLTSIFQVAPTGVLPIMVVNLLGPERNAYFYIAWMIVSLLFAIPVSVSRSLFAEDAHFEDELGANVRRSFRLTFLLLIPAIIILFLLSKWLLLLFGGSYAANSLLTQDSGAVKLAGRYKHDLFQHSTDSGQCKRAGDHHRIHNCWHTGRQLLYNTGNRHSRRWLRLANSTGDY